MLNPTGRIIVYVVIEEAMSSIYVHDNRVSRRQLLSVSREFTGLGIRHVHVDGIGAWLPSQDKSADGGKPSNTARLPNGIFRQ